MKLDTNRDRAILWYFFANMGGGEDTTAPVLQSAEVGTVAANILVLTYNENIDTGSVPATTDFTVNDGAANAVTNVSITAGQVRLTLTNNVEEGDTVVVSYTSGTNPIQDASGNDAADLTAESVTNNVAAAVYMTDKDGNNVLDKDGNPIQVKS